MKAAAILHLVLLLTLLNQCDTLAQGRWLGSDDYGFPLYDETEATGRSRSWYPRGGRGRFLALSRNTSKANITYCDQETRQGSGVERSAIVSKRGKPSIGDRVVVTKETANVMRGERVVGIAGKGAELAVRKVENGWVGVELQNGGDKIGGWIWHKHLRVK